MELFSDVEIFAAGAEGAALFAKVYAKVVKKQENVLWLNFTRDNKGFRNFLEKLFLEKKEHGVLQGQMEDDMRWRSLDLKK